MIHGNDVAKFCLRFPSLLNFLEFPPYPGATSFPVQTVSGKFRDSGSLSVATGFPVQTSSRASFCHPWELDAASGLEFRCDFTSGFPEHPICRLEALNITGLFDTIELFTDEELVETVTARFIAVGLDFCHNPVIFFLFLHLFVIVLVSWSSRNSQRSRESWNGWC